MTYKMLIVDDELANLRLLARLFSREFECLTASSGADAIRLLEQHDVAILITDQRMPQMTGIDLLRHTARLRPHMVRILLTGYTDVEVLVEAINSGLVYMYVTKPWNNDDLRLKINRACEHYESNKKSSALTLANERLLARLGEIKTSVVVALSDMLKARDEYAYDHAVRVRNYSTGIARRIGLSEIEIESLESAAMLHDLAEGDSFQGSTRARAFVPARVNFSLAHLECEAKLLAGIPELAMVADVIKFHHENFDGSRSPGRLSMEQIPIASRILRVAKEFDSLVQPKPPAASMRPEEAMRFLSQRSGKQFDPRIIQIMSQLSEGVVPKGFVVSANGPDSQVIFDPSFDSTFS
jgi:response regulator RpfG family c-di-GMP phosphodiesterase